jgi:hypothetical protein
MFFSLHTNAQNKLGADYFQGKWSLLVKGLPDGDTRMIFVLDKKDSSLAGVVQDSTGKEIAKLDKVELKDTTITVYFTAQGYDVNVIMNKKDEDHVYGSLMSMFDAEGERMKPNNKSQISNSK